MSTYLATDPGTKSSPRPPSPVPPRHASRALRSVIMNKFTKSIRDADEREEEREEEDAAPMTASLLPYTKDLVRGEMCAFMTGYFVFLAETEASVRSLQHFMPGVRVRVAVDPVYFSVFNR